MDYPKSDATVGLVGGKFTDGNPGAGVPASRDPSSWANAVTDEILNVLAGGGVVPDEADNAQLLAAILAVITGRFTGSSQLLTSAGYQKLPGGLILQWGQIASNFATANSLRAVLFPISFPTGMLQVVGVNNNHGSPGDMPLWNATDAGSLSQFNLYCSASGTHGFSWFGVGY